MCLPEEAVTFALIELSSITVVSVLLSSEKPMVLTDCEEQLEASAESWNGEETTSPFPGLLTETPASAGAANMSSQSGTRESFFNRVNSVPSHNKKWTYCWVT